MQHYTPSEVRQFAGNGRSYYKSFQYQQPPPDFTHLNMTPHIRGSSDHTFDNQWNSLYEYYQGEGEVKRDFYHVEQEPLFAPRKQKNPNLNNEWEHVYDQRNAFSKSSAKNWHNFERPPGTRLIVGPGIDPFYRQAYGDPNNPNDKHSYQWCPSLDWYRPPELTLEQLRGKTRNNFDITKNVKSGSKPIFHANLNAYKSTQLLPEKFWQNDGDMILPTKGAFTGQQILPSNVVRGHTKRTDHPHTNYIQPAFDETGGVYQAANFAPSLKKLMGLHVPNNAPHGMDQGQLHASRDYAYQWGNCGTKREDDQNVTRQGAVTGTKQPGLLGKMNNKLLTLYRERDLGVLAGVSGQVETQIKKPYVDTGEVPDNTKREHYLDAQARLGNPGNKLITKQTVLDPLSFNLKPTYRYETTNESRCNLTRIVNAQPVFDRDDSSQARNTIKQGTLHSKSGNINGGQRKHKVQDLSEVNRSLGVTHKEQMIGEYTATGGGVFGKGDPRTYDPETLERDVRKHVFSHKINDVGATKFTDGRTQQNRVRKDLFANRPDISSRPWGNIKGHDAINNTVQGTSTRGGNKRPEVNARMF